MFRHLPLLFLLPAGLIGQAATTASRQSGINSAAREITLLGRVVDERRFPVAKALVRVPSWHRPTAPTETDHAGRFRLTISGYSHQELEMVAVRAVARNLSGFMEVCDLIGMASQHANGWPSVVDIGTLTLLPSRTVRVTVSRHGMPAPDSRVFLQASRVFLDEGTTDQAGVATFPNAIPASWEFHVTARALSPDDTTGVVRARADKGAKLDSLQIDLLPARSLRLRVLNAATKEPIAGAATLLRVWPEDEWSEPVAVFSPVARTDAQGRTVLRNLCSAERLAVHVASPGYSHSMPDCDLSEAGAGRTTLTSNDVTVTLAKFSERCWNAGEGPPDGTTFELYPRWKPRVFEPTRVTFRSGNVCILPENLPDGDWDIVLRSDDWFAEQTEEYAQAPPQFQKVRPVHVQLRRPDGTPMAGARVRVTGGLLQSDTCWSSGTRWFGDRSQSRNYDSGTTDGAGRVTIRAHTTELALVSLDVGESPLGYVPLGAVDLSAAEKSLDAVVVHPTRVSLFVTLDGERRLPSDFELRCIGLLGCVHLESARDLPMAADPKILTMPPTFYGVAEDAGAGMFSFSVVLQPSARRILYLRGSNFETVAVDLAKLEPGTVASLAVSLTTKSADSRATSR